MNSYFSIIFAYLDPGTGSLILQIIASVFIAAFVAVKAGWHKMIHFFKKEKTEEQE